MMTTMIIIVMIMMMMRRMRMRMNDDDDDDDYDWRWGKPRPWQWRMRMIMLMVHFPIVPKYKYELTRRNICRFYLAISSLRSAALGPRIYTQTISCGGRQSPKKFLGQQCWKILNLAFFIIHVMQDFFKNYNDAFLDPLVNRLGGLSRLKSQAWLSTRMLLPTVDWTAMILGWWERHLSHCFFDWCLWYLFCVLYVSYIDSCFDICPVFTGSIFSKGMDLLNDTQLDSDASPASPHGGVNLSPQMSDEAHIIFCRFY